MNLEDLHTPDLIRQGYLNLPVQPPGPQQRWIKCVRAIRRHDNLRPPQIVKAVELVQQLHQRPLDLAVCRRALAEPPAADGVDLVHENDARFVFLRIPEHLADEPRGFANVLVHDGGGDHCRALAWPEHASRSRHALEEIRLQPGRHRARQQRLPRPRRPVQQDALGRLDADPQEQLRVLERQLDDLPQLPDLIVQTPDAPEGDLARVLERHVVYQRVDFAGEHPHDGEGGHVERDADALLQFRLLDFVPAADDVAGSAGGFDDDCLGVSWGG